MPERKTAGSGRPVGRPSSRSGTRPSGGTGGKSAASRTTAPKVENKVDTAKADAAKVDTAKAKVSTSATGATKSGAAKSSATKSGAAKSGATKSSGTKGSAGGSTASRNRPSGSGGKPPTGRPPTKTGGGKGGRPNKKRSIVNQKQTPWGLIITTAVVVVFAAAVVIAVVATRKTGTDFAATTKGGQAVSSKDPYRQPEAAAAAKIKGVTYRVEGQHTHVDGHIKYDSSPPVGGDHSQYWADCTGTVYKNAIANENAVHMLEHGAIWITYNKSKLSASQVATLAKNVSGVDRMAMSPYPNLKTPISLQAWGYQLFVSSPTDPRIAQFIAALKYNKATTPEYGATCSQPTFKTDPSTFGNPLWVPKNGSSGNTMGA